MAELSSAATTLAGVTYTYNGSLHPRTRMLINHFCLELEEEVEQKLINARLGVEDVSEEWLQAQLLLRAFGRPGEEVRRTKLDMISSLEIINAILEDKYYIVSLTIPMFITHHTNPCPAPIGASP